LRNDMSERRQQTRKGDSALHLFGVTVNDGHTGDVRRPDVHLVMFRDLAAICSDADYDAIELDEAAVHHASQVVAAFGVRSPVVPAPVGVVFRSEESLERWLELHYSALSGALSFVENRVAARVHVWEPSEVDEGEGVADVRAIAAESVRVLRRAAVACVPLKSEAIKGIVLSVAFLVEEELWKNFVDEVEAQGKTEQAVRFELTGPWPPYDFVQMQLGA
jgi:hypothetical protein